MAVASAGPYASLHLAPDRYPCQHPTTQFFTGRMPFLPPNQQLKALKAIMTKDLIVKHIFSFSDVVDEVYDI